MQAEIRSLLDGHERNALEADIVAYVRSRGFEPTPRQVQVLRRIQEADKLAIRTPHGFGKTAIVANTIVWWLSTRRPAKVVTTAGSFSQVKDILWPEVRRWGASAIADQGWEIPPVDPRIRTPDPETFAVGIRPVDPRLFEGYHSENLLVVVDEAKTVKAEIFESVDRLQPRKVILISTPGIPAGRFHDASLRDDWAHVHFDAETLANEPEERCFARADGSWSAWIQDMRSQYATDSPFYLQAVKASFAMSTANAYFPQDKVLAAIGREMPKGKPHWLGVDWGYRVDFTALVEGHGRRVDQVRTMQKDYMEVVGEIIEWDDRHGEDPFDAIIADEGEGIGQVARMRELGLPVKGRRWTHTSKRDDLSHLKADIEEGQISLPNHEWMKEQLLAFERRPTSSGDYRYTAPEGQHDDIVTALAMGWTAVAKGGSRVWKL